MGTEIKNVALRIENVATRIKNMAPRIENAATRIKNMDPKIENVASRKHGSLSLKTLVLYRINEHIHES